MRSAPRNCLDMEIFIKTPILEAAKLKKPQGGAHK